MIKEIEALVDDYAKWLRDKTVLRQVNDWVEITTPYVDRHNDYLQFYARRNDGTYVLTDDGYTIEDLRQSGCDLESPKRQALLSMTLNGFGIRRSNDSLVTHASPENFALRKHNLVQAILAINDLFYLAQPMVRSLFFEDVVAWLELSDIRYTPSVKFTGKSGFDHLFDFVIPKSRYQPERIARAITHPSRDTAQAMVFSWIDTREVRSPDSRAYALLNDSQQHVSSSVLEAFENYEVKPVLWSARDRVRDDLAA